MRASAIAATLVAITLAAAAAASPSVARMWNANPTAAALLTVILASASLTPLVSWLLAGKVQWLATLWRGRYPWAMVEELAGLGEVAGMADDGKIVAVKSGGGYIGLAAVRARFRGGGYTAQAQRGGRGEAVDTWVRMLMGLLSMSKLDLIVAMVTQVAEDPFRAYRAAGSIPRELGRMRERAVESWVYVVVLSHPPPRLFIQSPVYRTPGDAIRSARNDGNRVLSAIRSLPHNWDAEAVSPLEALRCIVIPSWKMLWSGGDVE